MAPTSRNSDGKYCAWELAWEHGNHWEHEKYCAWETRWEHGNTKLEAAQGRLGNPMGTWEHGNMGSDEATWEHNLGIKTTGQGPLRHLGATR